MVDDFIFEALIPLGWKVFVTSLRWDYIVNIKHPVIKGWENDVKEALENPDEIRRSNTDPDVYLFYRLIRSNRWICTVVKKSNNEGFLITIYPTDKIKEGERIWHK